MKLMRSEDTESGRYAALCLGNLAANANLRASVVDAGGAEALVALLCCDQLPAQRQALAALRSICISREYRTLVVRGRSLHLA